jgi:hypothetical protein
MRFSFFEKHFNHLPKIALEFVKCFGLGMCARKTRHVTYVKAGVRAPFNHSGKTSHDVLTDPPI